MKTLLDKIKGCIIGGAVGDALGYTVEFMDYLQIVNDFGKDGIMRYQLNHKGIAEISDDTQMTLYTANGLLIDDIKTAYLEWYQTQTIFGQIIANPKCWISKVPEMYSRRAPGNTCMSALNALSKGIAVHNNSKGCGGIMRVAPIALYGAVYSKDPIDMTRLACDNARMTHQHPLGWLPAGMLVYTIQKVLTEDNIHFYRLIDIIKESWRIVKDFEGVTEYVKNELYRGMDMAIAMAKDGCWTDEDCIRSLGKGWTGEEAWYIAIYSTLAHFNNFEKAIVAAVNHSGDSDSTGAICGNLIGAIHGYEAIPECYKQNLELHDVILKVAEELYNGQL